MTILSVKYLKQLIFSVCLLVSQPLLAAPKPSDDCLTAHQSTAEMIINTHFLQHEWLPIPKNAKQVRVIYINDDGRSYNVDLKFGREGKLLEINWGGSITSIRRDAAGVMIKESNSITQVRQFRPLIINETERTASYWQDENFPWDWKWSEDKCQLTSRIDKIDEGGIRTITSQYDTQGRLLHQLTNEQGSVQNKLTVQRSNTGEIIAQIYNEHYMPVSQTFNGKGEWLSYERKAAEVKIDKPAIEESPLNITNLLHDKLPKLRVIETKPNSAKTVTSQDDTDLKRLGEANIKLLEQQSNTGKTSSQIYDENHLSIALLNNELKIEPSTHDLAFLTTIEPEPLVVSAHPAPQELINVFNHVNLITIETEAMHLVRDIEFHD